MLMATPHQVVMVEVLLTFRYGAEFDEARIHQVAEAARGESPSTPSLRSKELMIDTANRAAVHHYVWDSEDAAHEFFTQDRIELVTALYRVRPNVQFIHQTKAVVHAKPLSDPASVATGQGCVTGSR